MMELSDQAKEPGAKVGAWNANNGSNQLWNFEPSSGGGYGQPQAQYQSYSTPHQPSHQHAAQKYATFALNH